MEESILKTCAWCRKALHQRPEETDSNYRRRTTCGKTCAGLLREAKRRKR